MSISKLVDNRQLSVPEDNICYTADCMYNVGGGCAAEWCIFNELPKMVTSSRTLTCSVCNEATKTVSIHSGITSFICEKCRTKIKKVTPDEKPCSVCGTNKVPVDQYICNDCQKKISKTIKNLSCPICGTHIEPGQSICVSCSSRIRGKLNE